MMNAGETPVPSTALVRNGLKINTAAAGGNASLMTIGSRLRR